MVSNKEKVLRINRRYFMATSVKNLNKKNGRMAVEGIERGVGYNLGGKRKCSH